MASMTSAAVTIPKFTGLKTANRAGAAAIVRVGAPAGPAKSFAVKASLREAAAGFAAGAVVLAAAAVGGSAVAAEVLLGSSDGGLVFEPSSFSVASGETITFKNNAGFPHNVVFDEDSVPSGVDAAKISMPEEDLLNAPGETYVVKLVEKGSYSFYCAPHQGAGMVGKVTVN